MMRTVYAKIRLIDEPTIRKSPYDPNFAELAEPIRVEIIQQEITKYFAALPDGTKLHMTIEIEPIA